MSSAGHVQDMINRLKLSKAQKPSNRGKFKGNARQAIYDQNSAKPLKFKNLEPKAEKELLLQIRKELHSKRRRELWIATVASIILLSLLMFFIL
jgi:hypothetical protein